MALAVKTDKTTYSPGETITATVTSLAGDRTVSDTLHATSGTLAGATVELTVTWPVAVTDDGNRAWTKVSDDGVTAVFRSVA